MFSHLGLGLRVPDGPLGDSRPLPVRRRVAGLLGRQGGGREPLAQRAVFRTCASCGVPLAANAGPGRGDGRPLPSSVSVAVCRAWLLSAILGALDYHSELTTSGTRSEPAPSRTIRGHASTPHVASTVPGTPRRRCVSPTKYLPQPDVRGPQAPRRRNPAATGGRVAGTGARPDRGVLGPAQRDAPAMRQSLGLSLTQPDGAASDHAVLPSDDMVRGQRGGGTGGRS